MSQNYVPIHERNPPVIEGDRILGEVFDHAAFIASIAQWIKPEVYLEYGVRDGHTLVQVLPHCRMAIGVDIYPVPIYAPNLELYQTTTDEFSHALADADIVLDMVFIDADHSSDSVLRDFEGIFPYLAPNALVFLHDTYPTDKRLLGKEACNDCWRTPQRIKKLYGDKCEILTLPFCPGLTIVRKIHNLEWSDWTECDNAKEI